jgi:hypothetical protein
VVWVSDWIVRELTTNYTDPDTVSDQVTAGLAAIGLDRARWDAIVPAVVRDYGELLAIFDIGYE